MSVNLTILIIATSTIIASLFIPQYVSKSLESKKNRRNKKDGKKDWSDLLASELCRTKKRGEHD